MRRMFAMAGLAAAIGSGALSFAIVPSAPTQAAATKTTFKIPAQDGYGLECGPACARVVADAWCEAQGFARSASIELAEAVEITSSLPGASRGPISVTCAE